MNRWTRSVLAVGAAACVVLAGCSSSSGGGGGSANSPSDPAKVSGSITVLTNRTDLNQDGTLKKYAAKFNAVYPKVHVTFQAITDYEGEVKTRMNTSNYGDVLLIPPSISRSDYGKFFASLGDAGDLSKKYNWVDTGTTSGKVSGKVYGLATFGNANGFVYNKKIWQQAGITADPTTPQQFLADLSFIKSKTSAVPYYTNYHDGWPLQGWNGALGSSNCDAAASDDMATDKAPFSASKGPGEIYSLLYDTAHAKLIEPDPTTTNWEGSKAMLATGKVATMWLGSWAMVQFQDAAKKAGANPADIGFMPYPYQKNGKFCSVTGPDYKLAINVHSSHKQAARAWLDWFVDKSGFATDQGSIPTAKGAALPSTLADYTKLGVSYIELAQAKAGTVSKIDNQSEVGFFAAPDTAQHLVDVARGAASGSLGSILSDLNKKWADGISTAGG